MRRKLHLDGDPRHVPISACGLWEAGGRSITLCVVLFSQAKKSDPEYWQWIFVEKGKRDGQLAIEKKGLQSTAQGLSYLARMGPPVDARDGRPITAPGYRPGTLREKHTDVVR